MKSYHLAPSGPELCPYSIPAACPFGLQNHFRSFEQAKTIYSASLAAEKTIKENVVPINKNDSLAGLEEILTEEEIEIFSKMRQKHNPIRCKGRICVIHNPLPHHMRYWTPVWHVGNPAIQRICPHGQEHPDPSVIPFLREAKLMHHAKHECDGCCKDKN